MCRIKNHRETKGTVPFSLLKFPNHSQSSLGTISGKERTDEIISGMVTELKKSFERFNITRIPQASNAQADKVSRLTFDFPAQLGRSIMIEKLHNATLE